MASSDTADHPSSLRFSVLPTSLFVGSSSFVSPLNVASLRVVIRPSFHSTPCPGTVSCFYHCPYVGDLQMGISMPEQPPDLQTCIGSSLLHIFPWISHRPININKPKRGADRAAPSRRHALLPSSRFQGAAQAKNKGVTPPCPPTPTKSLILHLPPPPVPLP